MPSPQTFQRLYRDHAGLEHHATDTAIINVTNSMRESVGGVNPFKVRVRMDDGSSVILRPKGWSD